MKFAVAQNRPLSPRMTQPKMKAHDIVCLHTMVGFLSSTDVMFKRNGYGGTESHFGIGGKWGGDSPEHGDLDGHIYQWVDTDFTADANYRGNPRVLSIETADNAPARVEDIQPWTDKQLTSIVTLVAELCRAYQIPPVLVQDSKPGRRGIAYHRQGCEHSDGIGSHPGWLVAGGERWSTSLGKGCPSEVRIAQLRNVVIPAVSDLLTGDVVLPADREWIKNQLTAALSAQASSVQGQLITALNIWANTRSIPNKPLDPKDPAGAEWTPENLLAAGDQKLDFIRQDQAAQAQQISEQGDRLTSIEATQAEILRLISSLAEK